MRVAVNVLESATEPRVSVLREPALMMAWGIGLEFKNRERLTEFFQKTRELYPDSSLQTDCQPLLNLGTGYSRRS